MTRDDLRDTPDRFAACLAVLFPIEGGYSNRSKKADPGGATNMGVTWKTYDAWRRSKGLPTQDVRKITREEAAAIYREWYWDAVWADRLPPGIDLCAFDLSVNSGAGTAIKLLQRTLGVPADSHLGPVTLGTLQQLGDVEVKSFIRAYVETRRQFGRSLRNYPDNPGWEPRWDNIERHALVMAGESKQTIPRPPAPLPDPDQQAAATGKAIAEDPKPPVGTAIVLALGGAGGTAKGIAAAFTKIAAGTSPILAFLSEETIVLGLVMLVGGLFTWRWRKAHA
jgi:lysozyme family protein